MKKLAVAVIVVALAAGTVWAIYISRPTKTNVSHSSSTSAKQAKKQSTSKASTFNKNLYSHTDPISIWVMVNKLNPLTPKSYTPSDLVVPNVPLRVPGNQTMELRQVAATAMETMFSEAKAQGINLMLASGYRSFAYQTSLYDGYVVQQGQATADQQSARPGYSEHQTGLAADVEPLSRYCEVEQCFATTPEGEWLAANSYKYGFIIRYPQGQQNITGYEYEPWHIRYIGVSAATEMHKENVTTLEQFFGYPPAPNY